MSLDPKTDASQGFNPSCVCGELQGGRLLVADTSSQSRCAAPHRWIHRMPCCLCSIRHISSSHSSAFGVRTCCFRFLGLGILSANGHISCTSSTGYELGLTRRFTEILFGLEFYAGSSWYRVSLSPSISVFSRAFSCAVSSTSGMTCPLRTRCPK